MLILRGLLIQFIRGRKRNLFINGNYNNLLKFIYQLGYPLSSIIKNLIYYSYLDNVMILQGMDKFLIIHLKVYILKNFRNKQ
jgi:hypothetical protein